MDGHLGLTGMAERARLVGGELAVESAPGTGTTVMLRLPGAPLPDTPDPIAGPARLA